MKRALLVLPAAALCALLAAPPAHAKGDVRAHLVSRLPLDAPAGKAIGVVWRLYSVENGKREAFGASGLFVRLRSKSGGRAVKAEGTGSKGRYVARVEVPKGGIGGIRFGLDGIRIVAGVESPAPVYFPLDNDPLK